MVVFGPLERSGSALRGDGKRQDRADEGRPAVSADPTPTVQPDTAFCTLQAAERYDGWPTIPAPPRQGASADDVKRLQQRLATGEGDLPAGEASQRRAGLQQSGMDKATLKSLNVPADVRAHELESSAKRLADIKIRFDQPYVVVNIPAASVEAVEDLRVVQRHTAIEAKSIIRPHN